MPYISELNVLTYNTVRAGGAALTGFFFCILVGPRIIRMLQALKAGQYIKQDHVEQLHALHKGKAGTPTMGGTMIILSTVLSLALWGTLSNRFLWIAVGVLVLLGTVGFVDDYIKLKRKHNDGLSAKAKFLGQILTGTVLGLYLQFNPITVSNVQERDVLDWPAFVERLAEGSTGEASPAFARIWEWLDPQAQATILASARWEAMSGEARAKMAKEEPWHIPSSEDRYIILRGVNRVISRDGLYTPEAWKLEGEAVRLANGSAKHLSSRDTLRLNRLLLEQIMPDSLAPSIENLHTKVGVPGFKNLFIPLGMFYFLFVIFVIVAVSNAVNVTDGLDGLAAGVSIISIMAYAGIAYVVSRADWSQYLFLVYVPEASELFVFGAALLGTGLGFLWFNSHPAEIFMGDTGSLALGGAIATMALLTKQELLIPLVAGIFVLEAASVTIQVFSFKLTGKRVFRMAPIHHHFELGGWTETKVVMRFWIIALFMALMSLATLKLR